MTRYDRVEHQNRIKNVRVGTGLDFALIPEMYDSRLVLESGAQLLNNQRMSYLYHHTSATKHLQSNTPYEQILASELMHSNMQNGKEVNFEMIDSPAYQLYAHFPELLAKIEQDEVFKQDVLSDKDPDLVISELFERLQINPQQFKKRPKTYNGHFIETYGSPHDIHSMAPINTRNIAHKDEALYKLLEENPLSETYWKSFTNGFDVLDDQYQLYQKSLDSIAKKSKDPIVIYDIYSDNKTKKVNIHQNAHGMIMDREFESWSADEHVAFFIMNRAGMKDYEQSLHDIFGKVSSVQGASNGEKSKASDHVSAFFLKNDFSKVVNPLDLQPLQASFLNSHQIDGTRYDRSFNQNIPADILADFKEHSTQKYLYSYKKNMIEPLKAPRKLVTSKQASSNGVYVNPKTFEKLYELGVVTNTGDIAADFYNFDFSQEIIKDNEQENQTVVEALQHALYGDRKINLDLLDESDRLSIKLNTPTMGSLSLIDILENANSGSTADERIQSATNTYTVLLDMVKSMTGIDSQTSASQGLPDIQYDKGVYTLNIYPDANWVANSKPEDQESGLTQVKNKPLSIKSKSKENLLDFYDQVRQFVAFLEPLVISFMKKDTTVSYYDNNKLTKGPLQVLNNNLGSWDYESNSVITKDSPAYKLWVDTPADSSYFQSDEMKKATKIFRDRLDEATFLKMFEKYVYGIQVKSEHSMEKKEEKEKQEEESRKYLEEVKELNRQDAQDRAKAKKKENENKKEEKQRIATERFKKLADAMRQKLLKKEKSSKSKGRK